MSSEEDVKRTTIRLRALADTAEWRSVRSRLTGAADLIQSQQQRIRELEAGRDIEQTMLRNGAELVEYLREQLATRDAVIAKVAEVCDRALSKKLAESDTGDAAMAALAAVIKREALDAAPESTLAEHDARVLEELADEWGENEYIRHYLQGVARSLRKGAGQ